jgi:hypothetical protein
MKSNAANLGSLLTDPVFVADLTAYTVYSRKYLSISAMGRSRKPVVISSAPVQCRLQKPELRFPGSAREKTDAQI